ncbi:MAG: ATP-grasp domain-containing protein [Desulfobacterales bacterium]|nr:ATP-grasp domain-containing protein [Desulfobacterales bacterium]
MHQTREVWEKYPSVWLLNDKAFKFAFNKVKIYDLATSLGIPIPRTIVLDQTVNITDNLSDIPLPTIVKPICSVNTEDLKNKNYVRCLSTREDLLGYIHDLIRQQAQVAIQEVVPGRGVGIEVLASNGKILYAFQHQRLHETSGFGSTYRKSVQLEPHLVEATSRLLSALDYTGVAMVEFRVDDASGHWVLLEINARFWGSLPLAVAAGADFPYYLYQLLVDGKQHFPPDYRLNVYSRQFLDDFRWIWRTLSSNGQEGREAGWEINPISTRQLVADVWRALTFRDHIDTFVWDDPGPFTGELRQTLALAISRFLPRKNTTL